MDPAPSNLVAFGAFQFHLGSLELTRSGARRRLAPQPARLLALLVRARGELVTRDTIRRELWGDQTVVDFEHGVNTCVRQIRHALGDRADAPRFVETLPKRGYRFVAPVEAVARVVSATAEAPAPQAMRRRRWWPWALAVLLVSAGIAVALTASLRGPRFDDLPAGTPAPPTGRIRLAVLPFRELGSDLERDDRPGYLAQGLTETLIFHLARLHPERLGVIARASVLPFAQGRHTAREIGAELDVHYLLEGSVRHDAREGVTVRAMLVQVADQTQLWSDSFHRPLTDLASVQDQLAARIADSLTVELLHPERASARRYASADPDALDAYLQARFEWNRFDGPGLERAVALYRRALELDPGFGAARAGLAEAYCLLPWNGVLPAAEAYALAEETALAALELDETLAGAWTALGFVHLYHHWDGPASDRAFARAVELEPGYAMAYHWQAGLLSATERHDETITALRLALELDPLSLSVRSDLAWYYLFADRWAEGAAEARVALAREPGHGWSLAALGLAERRQGNDAAAWDAMRRQLVSGGATERGLEELDRLPPAEAWKQACRRGLPSLEGGVEAWGGDSFFGAARFAAAGELEGALALLELALEQHHGWMVFLAVDPRFDALARDPRFTALVAAVGMTSGG